jgi:hypothetical protein
MVYVDPGSKYMQTICGFLERKRRFQLDASGKYPSKEVEDVIAPLVKWIDSVTPAAKETYPTSWATEWHVVRETLQTFVSQAFSRELAELFNDFSLEELEGCASSFSFEKCLQREGLNRILTEHAEISKKALEEGPSGERLTAAESLDIVRAANEVLP